jgi:hypothetical protein
MRIGPMAVRTSFSTELPRASTLRGTCCPDLTTGLQTGQFLGREVAPGTYGQVADADRADGPGASTMRGTCGLELPIGAGDHRPANGPVPPP